MKKQKLYNVTYLKNKTKVETIKLTESFMWELLECYEGKELDKKNQDIIIKYILPDKNKEEEVSSKALDELMEGIEIKGKRYIPFLTSPSMMKKSSNRRKCEYLFIREDYDKFKEVYRDIISLGRVKRLQEKDKICINKDVISRESLTLSGSYRINYNPYLLILPSQSYEHISNYITIDKETGELKEQLNEKKSFEAFDGCGLMSPKMAKKIQEDIKSEHNIDFAIIRNFPLAVKGLVVKCDFIKFFEDNYKEDKKYTEYFKKENGKFYAKDIYDCWIDLSKVDLITTTNMAKWAKIWDASKDNLSDDRNINDAVKEVIEGEYEKYKGILNNLYVTKVNKESLKEYIKISYQILNNLALTTQELREIQNNSIKYLKKIISLDVNYIKLWLGDIASDIKQDEDGNIINEVTASTKAHRMLQVNSNFVKSKTIRSLIKRNILKSCHEVITKPYVKGNFKYAIDDPICFLRWIVTRDLESSRELKEGEFYVPKESGNVVMTRNPLAIAGEVHRIKLVENEVLDEYFGDLTNEIIMFNTVDDMSFISSGSDKDGDAHAIWYDEAIYNAVIEPDLHFNFVNDGDTYECLWTPEEEYTCVLKASGNLIGAVSNITTKLSNKAQEQGYIFNGEHYTVKEIKNKYMEVNPKYKEEITKLEQQKKKWEDEVKRLKQGNYEEDEDYTTLKRYESNKELYTNQLKNKHLEIRTKAVGTLIKMGAIELSELPAEKQRDYIKQGFKKYERDMLEALMWSQVAIDASKTCVVPTQEDMYRIIKYKKENYPRFMYHAKFKKDNEEIDWDRCSLTNSALDITSNEIYHNLIKGLAELIKEGNESLTVFKEVMGVEECEEAVIEVDKIYKRHLEYVKASKSDNEEEAAKITLEILEAVEELDFTPSQICYAFLNANQRMTKKGIKRGVTTEFIVKYFYYHLAKTFEGVKTDEYVLDENGEFDWLFKNYKNISANLAKDNLLQMQKEDNIKKIPTLEFNVGALTGYEGSIKVGDEILIKQEQEGKYTNYNVYVDGNKKVGFIFARGLDIADGQVLKVYDWKYITNNKYIKIKVA